MVATCAVRLASAPAVSVTLRSALTPSEISTHAEIKPDHQRRDQRELDRRDAALIAREAAQKAA